MKISGVNSQLLKEINFQIIFCNLEHFLFCKILQKKFHLWSDVIGQLASVYKHRMKRCLHGFRKFISNVKCLLSKKIQNFYFQVEFQNKFPMWKGPNERSEQEVLALTDYVHSDVLVSQNMIVCQQQMTMMSRKLILHCQHHLFSTSSTEKHKYQLSLGNKWQTAKNMQKSQLENDRQYSFCSVVVCNMLSEAWKNVAYLTMMLRSDRQLKQMVQLIWHMKVFWSLLVNEKLNTG